MTKTVEDLKRMYSHLTDKELVEEYKYRNSYSTRMVCGDALDILINSKKAVIDLMRERGIEPST
jgi:hypothetical protein